MPTTIATIGPSVSSVQRTSVRVGIRERRGKPGARRSGGASGGAGGGMTGAGAGSGTGATRRSGTGVSAMVRLRRARLGVGGDAREVGAHRQQRGGELVALDLRESGERLLAHGGAE